MKTVTPDQLLGPLNDVELKNAPASLFVEGDLGLLDAGPRVAVVGTRKPSPEGSARARAIAKALVARSIVVVSGLAEGVDTLAHETALAEGGKTIAVLGRSAPLKDPNALWPAQRICARLVEARLGREVLPCLRRTAAVPKSTFASIGERPDVGRHAETMAVERSLLSATRITVVDDIVTKGATLLAATSRIAEAFVGAEVRAFALLRTLGLIPEIDRIVSPCSGTITFEHGDVLREP